MPAAVRVIVAILGAVFFSVTAAAADSDCFQGTRDQARQQSQQRLGLLCQLFCSGCGCKGGPGLRKSNGYCASSGELAAGACGEAPAFSKCAKECTPLHAGCSRGALPTADTPPQNIDYGIKLVEVTGEDTNGRRAAFDVLVISDGLTWKYKADSVARGGRELSRADLKRLFEERFTAAFDIIATGAASSEGPRSIEERRAQSRGSKLAEMIASTTSEKTKLWVLNLGQYLDKCSQCTREQTSAQRPVMIIGVVHRQVPDVDIREALVMAFSRRSDLPQPAEFSLFDLSRHR
jgi:hypothetical protein